MELDDIFSTRGSETERSTPGALLSQLKSKLHSQSTQLRLLDSYKSLCEQRILDLYPNHPLPIQKDHIGQYLYSETLPLKQKISKLEEKLSKYCDPYLLPSSNSNSEPQLSLFQRFSILLKEKAETDESLRCEMRLNEEQRSYIEVLRQALEINIEKLGLEGLSVDDFVGFVQIKAQMEDKNKELAKANLKIRDLDTEMTALKEVVYIKQAENQQLDELCTKIGKKLNKKSEKVKELSEDIEKLEEEKSRLIDYIDNTLVSETRSAEALKETCEKLEKLQKVQMDLKSDNVKTSEKLQEAKMELENEKEKTVEKLAKMNNDCQKKEKELKEAQKWVMVLRVRIEEKDMIIKEVNKELEDIKNKNEVIQETVDKVLRENQEVGNELERVKSSLQVANVAEKKSLEKIDELQKGVEELEERNQRLSENLHLSESELVKQQVTSTKLTIDLQTKTEEASSLLSSLHLSQSALSKLQSDSFSIQISLESSLKSFQVTNEDLRNSLQTLQLTLPDYESKLLALSEENKTLKIKLETVSQLSAHSEANNLDLSVLESELSNLHQRFVCSNTLQSENQDLSSKLKIISQTCEFLQQELDSLRQTQQEVCDALKSLNTLFQCPVPEPCSILSLISSIAQQVHLVLSEKSSLQKENQNLLTSTKSSLNTLNKLEQELSATKSENSVQKAKLEKQNLEILYLNDSLKSQVATLQGEIAYLRSTVKELNEQSEKTSDLNRKIQLELSQNKYKLFSSEVTIQSNEEKYNLLLSEKTQLSNLIKRIQTTLESPQLQRIISETLRIHSELEYCSLEKLRISMQLRKADTADRDLCCTLQSQLDQCSCTISKHLSKLNLLETELETNSLLTITP